MNKTISISKLNRYKYTYIAILCLNIFCLVRNASLPLILAINLIALVYVLCNFRISKIEISNSSVQIHWENFLSMRKTVVIAQNNLKVKLHHVVLAKMFKKSNALSFYNDSERVTTLISGLDGWEDADLEEVAKDLHLK